MDISSQVKEQNIRNAKTWRSFRRTKMLCTFCGFTVAVGVRGKARRRSPAGRQTLLRNRRIETILIRHDATHCVAIIAVGDLSSCAKQKIPTRSVYKARRII